jgi:hypothetical protein
MIADNIDYKKLNNALHLCLQFSQNLAYLRTISLNLEHLKLEDSDFWTTMHNNCLDISTLCWWKLFGSDQESQHWKNIISEHEHNSFRQKMLDKCSVTQSDWQNVWGEIQNYRNNFLAHLSLSKINKNKKSNYPDFKIPFSLTAYYWDYLRKEIKPFENEEMRGCLITTGYDIPLNKIYDNKKKVANDLLIKTIEKGIILQQSA